MTVRRAFLVAAAAVALVLVPSAAMAYNAPGFSSSVSDSTPAVGQPIHVTIVGGSANANQMIKLVITSKNFTMTLNKRANANGTVKFTFKLDAAGKYTVEALNAAGSRVSDMVLTVGGASGPLPRTGSDSLGLALGGGAFVLVGAGAVAVARRRRSSSVPA